MKELPVGIEKMFMSADGYLDLQMYDEAREELQRLPVEYRKHCMYLWMMNRLSSETGDWETAARVSRSLCEMHPDRVDTWVSYAYAVRRHENILSAHTILLQAIERFDEDAIIPYNLACYECQLGNNEKAKKYLKRAISLDNSYRTLALEDEDLETLKEEITHL